MSKFHREFARETWSLYAVGLVVICLRFGARIKKLGIVKLQADDYLMANALIWYTILVISVNKIISGGGSNYMTPEEKASLTPEAVPVRIKGSKWVFVSEHAMVLTVWSLKLCMLCIYSRLTHGLKQKKLIRLLFVWVACGFVGTELCLFLACRPFVQYWAVPPSSIQCATYQHYEITEAIFNTSSDIMMLLIAVPLLLSVRLPLQQKAVLLIVFGMGIFVIVAAILTKIYCLVPSLISYIYLNWYFREASVSIYVTNLPALWSLARDLCPPLRSWGFDSKKSLGSGNNQQWPSSTYRDSSAAPPLHLQPFNRLGSGQLPALSQNQNQERNHEIDRERAKRTCDHHHHHHHRPLEIHRNVTFTVEKEWVENGDLEQGRGRCLSPPRRGETRCTAERLER